MKNKKPWHRPSIEGNSLIMKVFGSTWESKKQSKEKQKNMFKICMVFGVLNSFVLSIKKQNTCFKQTARRSMQLKKKTARLRSTTKWCKQKTTRLCSKHPKNPAMQRRSAGEHKQRRREWSDARLSHTIQFLSLAAWLCEEVLTAKGFTLSVGFKGI